MPPSISDATIGANIARLRTAKPLSQAELGAAVGLAQQTVAKIEVGERSVKLSEAAIFAAALGVRVEALIGGDDVESVAAALAARVLSTERSAVNLLAAAFVLNGQLSGLARVTESKDWPPRADEIPDEVSAMALALLEADWGAGISVIMAGPSEPYISPEFAAERAREQLVGMLKGVDRAVAAAPWQLALRELAEPFPMKSRRGHADGA